MFVCFLACINARVRVSFYEQLPELPGVARKSRQPLHELTTPCTTQSIKFWQGNDSGSDDFMPKSRLHEVFVPYMDV